MPSEITVRYADASSEAAMDAETREIAKIMVGSHLEAGVPAHIAPVDHAKALQCIKEAVREGLVLMAYDGDALIGVLGALQYDFWYSSATLLAERFFYIRPEYRADGRALRAIVKEAQAVADELGIIIHLTIARAHKRRPVAGLEHQGDVITYFPRGSAYRIAPAEKESA